MHLALLVLLLSLLTNVIEWVGKSVLIELVSLAANVPPCPNHTTITITSTHLSQIPPKTKYKQAFSTIYAPIFLRSLSTRQRKLKKQILEDKRQLVSTSSQDEFAKWAKLRRTLDKGLKDLEGLSERTFLSFFGF
jgi:hypothetical protein